MADYILLGSEPVESMIPGLPPQVEQQVTAQARQSGVIFRARYLPVVYADTSLVVDDLNGLAARFDSWSAIPGVRDITTYQDITPQDQLREVVVVDVQSTSGRSSQTFEWRYPVAEFNTSEPLIAKVDAVRKSLDAVEGG